MGNATVPMTVVLNKLVESPNGSRFSVIGVHKAVEEQFVDESIGMFIVAAVLRKGRLLLFNDK